MSDCYCDKANYDDVVRPAVALALVELTKRPGALSVLRNGGWEQWLRNLLLINLENGKTLGFTEAAAKKTKRADLIFYCKLCNKIAFGIEVKTNFCNSRDGHKHENKRCDRST